MIYGYSIVDKDGVAAPTNRGAYDSRAAAAVGFNHWAKRVALQGPYSDIKDKKITQQDRFRVVALVGIAEL